MEANAKLQGSSSVTRVVGPGLGGLAAQALGPVPTLLFDAGSFVVSAITLRQIPDRGSRAASRDEPRTIRSDIAEGLRFVFHDRYLRPLTLWAAAANFGIAGYFALIVVFLVRSVGLHAGLVGTLLTAGGLAGVLGAVAARRLTERFGTARTLVVNCSLSAPCGFVMVFAHKGLGTAFAVVGIFGLEGGLVLGSIVLSSFNQGYVPSHLLGRVATSTRLVTYGIAPVGALVAGALAGAIDIRRALGVMLAVDVAAVGLLLTGPFRGRRDLPVRSPAGAGPSPAGHDVGSPGAG
jgi:predicted MFS family arabinose efflux permease